MHMYLMAISFMFIILPLGLMSEALPDPVANLYYLMIITFFICMVYYILRVFVISYKQAGGQE